MMIVPALKGGDPARLLRGRSDRGFHNDENMRNEIVEKGA